MPRGLARGLLSRRDAGHASPERRHLIRQAAPVVSSTGSAPRPNTGSSRGGNIVIKSILRVAFSIVVTAAALSAGPASSRELVYGSRLRPQTTPQPATTAPKPRPP